MEEKSEEPKAKRKEMQINVPYCNITPVPSRRIGERGTIFANK